MKRITVFTGTRAEYHLLYPVLKKIQLDDELELDIIVTGTHLSDKFGRTEKAILADGFKINKRIEILDENGETDIDEAISKCLLGTSKYFKEVKTDMLIILGDRYEIFGPVISAMNAHIPIVYIHGGETTEGAIDEAIRHATSKCSYLHFTSCEEYRERVIQLGENPNTVYNVGGLGVENIKTQQLMSREDLAHDLDFDLTKFGLVTFHPVTLESSTAISQVKELLASLDDVEDMTFVVTKANADQGGNEINLILDEHQKKYPNKFKVVFSLGLVRYLSAMNCCEMVIGNSSSGILEAPSFNKPTINIGDRQKGRIQATSIINCKPIQTEISEAINKASSITFKESIKDISSPYENEGTSDRIIEVIKEKLNEGIDLKKTFYDIDLFKGGEIGRGKNYE